MEFYILYISSKESFNTYGNVREDLYDRGVKEPLLLIAGGIPKSNEEIRRVYSKFYFQLFFQLFTIHASRNLESEVRESDENIIDSQLKQIFLSEGREEASKRFNEFNTSGRGNIPSRYTI